MHHFLAFRRFLKVHLTKIWYVFTMFSFLMYFSLRDLLHLHPQRIWIWVMNHIPIKLFVNTIYQKLTSTNIILQGCFYYFLFLELNLKTRIIFSRCKSTPNIYSKFSGMLVNIFEKFPSLSLSISNKQVCFYFY